MKYVRSIVIVLAGLVVLGIAGWYFVGWSLDRAFQSATKEGGGLRKVMDVTEAALGSTLAHGDARLQLGKASGGRRAGLLSEEPAIASDRPRGVGHEIRCAYEQNRNVL
jgi:hypothetical protein